MDRSRAMDRSRPAGRDRSAAVTRRPAAPAAGAAGPRSASGSAVSPVCTGPGWTTVLRGAVSQRNRRPRSSRAGGPASGSPPQMSAAALQRPVDDGRVGVRVQRPQPVDVQVDAGAEEVAAAGSRAARRRSSARRGRPGARPGAPRTRRRAAVTGAQPAEGGPAAPACARRRATAGRGEPAPAATRSGRPPRPQLVGVRRPRLGRVGQPLVRHVGHRRAAAARR